MWQRERRLCEAVSITGRACTKKAHRSPTDKVTDENRQWPVSEHSNDVHTRAFCNCGTTFSDKPDPFDIKVY